MSRLSRAVAAALRFGMAAVKRVATIRRAEPPRRSHIFLILFVLLFGTTTREPFHNEQHLAAATPSSTRATIRPQAPGFSARPQGR
jgi:hypothetical protein